MNVPQPTTEEQAALNRVTEALESAKSTHEQCRRRWEHFYRLYRNYQQTPAAAFPWKEGTDRGLVYDARREWGAELFIPYCFSTIETIVPRAVSQRPRMLVLPRTPGISEANAEPMRMTIDAQQEQIDYDLVLQDVLRTGLIYGLGVQKVFWSKEYALRRRVKRRIKPLQMLGRGAYTVGRLEVECLFDDPAAEWVDPFDFFWDPFADGVAGRSTRRARWVAQRMWLSHEQVMERLTAYGDKPATWSTESAQALTLDAVKSIANGAEYDTIWNERRIAAGLTDSQRSGDSLHEVIEFHDGKRVITVLDRKVVVQDAENPTLGHIPFQVYRPTKVGGEMVGIGEIEPIEHLQLELNTLRSQRRDNATLKLMQSYAFDDSIVDQDDIVFGPGMLIPVNGDPNNAIKPLTVGDIPSSGYQEEAAIVNDIQRTTGVDDTVAGADGAGNGASATATGVQLVQAAANKRIELKARRLETEVIRGAARIMGRLNQRMILDERMRRTAAPAPEEGADPNEKRYLWFKAGPDEMRGEFDYVPEGGSTQPENTPQLRQDAQMLWSTFRENPNIDQTHLTKTVLEKMGVDRPESWLVQRDPAVAPGVLERLVAAGVPEDWVQRAVAAEQQADPTGGQMPEGDPEQQEAAA